MAARLILASTSPYRRRLLERLRVPFQAQAHRADESEIQGIPVHQVASRLAVDKALSLRSTHPDSWILGSDQVVVAGGEILGKPGDRPGARAQLERLRGTTHELVTAVTLVGPDGRHDTETVTQRMTMRSLDDGEIERYLDADQPFDCCGSYKIESLGIALIDSIEGPDFTAIEGLPLIATSRLLRAAGFEVP
jgi:septum formation protein